MSSDQPVITGWAVRSGPAQSLGELWALALAGPQGPLPPPRMPVTAPPGVPSKIVGRLDIATAHVTAAAIDAWNIAGAPSSDPDRRIVRLGIGYSGLDGIVDGARDPSRVRPFLALEAAENIPAAAIASILDIQGSVRVLCSACATGADAILEAAHEIEAGRADIAIAGGSQGEIPDFLLDAYRQLRVISPDGHLRPFDRRRNGFCVGAAAAIVVLESASHCRDRGGTALATILGGRSTNDAASMTTPNGIGLAKAIQGALNDAGLSPEDIQHVNAHGTGTIANDRIEGRTIAQLIGPSTPVTSTKPITGHPFAATGALELILASMSLREGLVPPCSLDFQRDPDIDIDVVHSEPRQVWGRAAMSTSVGLGGQNTALIVGLPE